MFNVMNTTITVAVTFFITLLLSTLSEYYFNSKGTVNISGADDENGRRIVVLTIENHSSEFINELALEIPKSTHISSFSSSSSVEVVEQPQPYLAGVKVIRINKLNPRQVTRILIPLEHEESSKTIKIVNAESSGLETLSDDSLGDPFENAILKSLFSAVVSAIFLYLAITLSKRHFNEAISQLRAHVESAHSEARKQAESVGQLKRDYSKSKLLLLSRISDYAKELDFWRNTIRKLVVTNVVSKKSSDEIVNLVTRELKTYGTSNYKHDFEAIKVAAAWLNASDGDKKIDKNYDIE